MFLLNDERGRSTTHYDTCKRFGVTIYFQMKMQVFHNTFSTLFSINNKTIENVRVFTNLGQVIMTEEKGRFTGKFNELCVVLTDNNVNLRTKWKLLEVRVR